MLDYPHLVRRDHEELAAGLRELARPQLPVAELRTALDGVRLGLTAHAEAEDIVLYAVVAHQEVPPFVQQLIAEARRAHLEQEAALSALLRAVPDSPVWRRRGEHLLDLVRRHATHEDEVVIPALRAQLPEAAFARLAGAFASERLRQLGTLQPSAVYTLEDVEARLAVAS